MSGRVIGTGLWAPEGVLTVTSIADDAVAPLVTLTPHVAEQTLWSVGQIVDVRPRTWAGINRPGGTGRITKIHYATLEDGMPPMIDGIDVKYTVNTGYDHHLSPDLLQPHMELETRGRRQRGRTTVTDSENEHPNQTLLASTSDQPKRSKSRKNIVIAARSAKNDCAAATAKKGASKKVTPTKHRPKNGPRKTLRAMFQPEAVAPLDEVAATDIPREITVNSSEFYGANSSSRMSEPSCSPLGQDGIEIRRLDAARDRDTIAGVRLNESNMDDVSVRSDNDQMECDDAKLHEHVLQLVVSPTYASSTRESMGFSTTHLATGRYSNESNAATSHKRDQVNADSSDIGPTTDKPVTLRRVFDHGVEKAKRFIGEVVASTMQEPQSQVENPTLVAKNERFCQFREKLYALFMECDDVVQVSSLADQIRGAGSDLDYIFTDSEIDEYVSQLCEQDKVMLIDESIYKI